MGVVARPAKHRIVETVSRDVQQIPINKVLSEDLAADRDERTRGLPGAHLDNYITPDPDVFDGVNARCNPFTDVPSGLHTLRRWPFRLERSLVPETLFCKQFRSGNGNVAQA